MSMLTVASGQSVYRGYEYFLEKNVQGMEQAGEGLIRAIVAGNGGNTYETLINIDHPKRSKCNCPHAAERPIVCKHMIAVYFTAFPVEAKKYITELENCWEEEELRNQEQDDRLIQYVRRMKKNDLQEALLQLLFDGPEWQYERFIRDNLEY